jgi:PAS domain S-box-containing protein
MKKFLRILHVEDQEQDVALLTRHLKKAGYQVESRRVDTATAMKAALQNDLWDVILCDYSMPQLNALAALSLLKETGLDIPLIIISGTVGEAVAVEVMRSGAHDYLMKDNLVRLLPAIEREIHEAENRRARKRAEEALKISEAQLRALFAALTDVIFVFNAEGRYLEIAPTNPTHVYKSSTEKFGKTLHEILPQAPADLIVAHIRRALAEGHMHRVEYSIEINGAEVWFDGSVSPISDQAVVWVGRDITERKRTEQALIESEGRKDAILKSALDCVVTVDHEGKIIDFNPAAEETFGYASENVVGKAMGDLIIPQRYRQRHEEGFARYLATGVTSMLGKRIEMFAMRADGSEIPVELTITAIGRHPRPTFTAFIRDLTERRQAETEQARLNAQLESQRQRLKNIVTNVPGVVWEAWGDPATGPLHMDFISDYVETMLGYSVEEWLTTPNLWLDAIHPEDRERAAREGSAHFAACQSFTIDFRWITRDGREIWVESNTAVITDEEGKPVGLRGVNTDISERKRAEEALRESEERYRNLVENAHDIIYEQDLKGNYTSANKAAEMITGYTLEESLKLNSSQMVAPEYQEKARDMLRRKLAGKTVTAYELEVIAKDGRRIPVEVNTRLVIHDGVPIGVQGIARDITERKLAEENLRRQLDFTNVIAASLGEGLYALDRNGKVTFMNPAAEAALGWNFEELRGREAHDVIHFQDLDGMHKPVEDCTLLGVIRSGQAVKVDNDVFTRKDGTMFPVAYTSAPIVSSGQPIGAVLAFHDITERKRAEEELRESEERYRLLFESNPQPMWVYDVETLSFLAVNQSAVAHYGYSRDEFLEMTIKDIRPEEDIPSMVKAIAEFSGGVDAASLWRHRKKDGTIINVEITAHSLVFDGRRAELILANDVTERKRLEAALLLSEEQLRQSQKLEAIGQLAGGVAHDFNNLLTAINGYSELSIRRLGDGHPVATYLEEIKKAGDRAANLTRQLLAFGRKQLLQPLSLNLNEVVSDMSKMLMRLIGENISFQTKLSPDLKRIKADPGQVEQVLVNLVVNARDAMPRGGVLTIETANGELDQDYASRHVAVVPGKYAMLAVSDTGIGMDAEVQAHVFEPFFTTKEKGKGTGLGLSTVYGIVKQSGGNIWVYSEPGQGTSFKVYLPLIEDELESSPAPVIESPVQQGSETVLLVEDEEMVRKLVSQLLEGNGYRVLMADGGEEAIELFTNYKEPIDLLITDVVMPKMSGKEVADQLKNVHPETKVLYMSGYTDEAIVHQGIVDADIAFIQKPFSENALARKVREVLNAEAAPDVLGPEWRMHRPK